MKSFRPDPLHLAMFRRQTRVALLSSASALALLVGASSVAAAGATTGNDAEIQQLREQVQMLMNRLQEMEAKQESAAQTSEEKYREELAKIAARQEELARQQAEMPTPANVVTAGDHPGTWKLPGSNTSIKFGGYVKVDLIYDVNADTGDSFAASAIPMEGTAADNRDGNVRLHARQSRLRFDTWTPTSLGELGTHIEGDFFGGGGNEVFSNSTSFRFRHAYGELGPFLAGQTWSNFMPLNAYPSTVDFFGPAGIPFIRQAQLRYTANQGEPLSVSFSVENPEVSGRTDKGTTVANGGGGISLDTLPDFTAALNYDGGDGRSAKLSGVVRQLNIDNGAAFDDSEVGWGVHASGVLPLGSNDRLMANFTYGDGIGRYLINGFNNDLFFREASNRVETIESWGSVLAVEHRWNSKAVSNVVWGHYSTDTFAPTDIESLDTFHVNLMYDPVDNVTVGLEYIYGMADFKAGSNDASRVQFAAQYRF